MLFITRDGTGQIVWLETGSQTAGMQHIISRHAVDFQSKHGVSETDIANHLKDVVQQGIVKYSRVTKYSGGYERLYSYNGNYYLVSGIGKNGFIVSAYPIGENEAKKLVERYGK